MSAPDRWHLFEVVGVELEYMIVDRSTLAVRPVADEVLRAVAGEIVSDVETGELAWSNELVLHVIELKTNGPAESLAGLETFFDRDVRRINGLLEPLGARLMPTAMHPFMDPHTETRLWPHEYSPIYEAYDRIFSCRGHGWSNLQSLHLNLPFADDEEFARLHAAVRLLLPILPALAASSPIFDGRPAGSLDNRMEFYRVNSRRIPALTGEVIPEPVFSRADYEREVFEPMYRAIAPHDPDGVLRDEFLNSRGAIARFGRGSLEIRVIDVQECPRADLAIAALTLGALEWLASGRGPSLEAQKAVPVAPLAAMFRRTIVEAEATVIDDAAYLELLGLPDKSATAGEVWQFLAGAATAAGTLDAKRWSEPLAVLFKQGSLARRILKAVGESPSRERLEEVYRRLCDCLGRGEMFLG